ncbi:MAG TPA: glycosyltransferase [Nitrospirales bacterium]|nr:glycosyltransferase [Nitrospirales bacterium]
MRILHIGNIANNAYNNAKFLRRKGVDADVLCYDYRHIMAQPEWEDATFQGDPDEFHPDWAALDLHDFRRPDWFKEAELWPAVARRRQWFRGQRRLQRMLLQIPWFWTGVSSATFAARATGSTPSVRMVDIAKIYMNRPRFMDWFRGYDLIQAYATEPIHAWLFGGGTPYLAFEHGTMREIPFEPTGRGRLLSLAYRQAAKVFITNPDVIGAARRLGLKNHQFIPHPIDETKYTPGPSPFAAPLRKRYRSDLICFAPSRHNWALKGNDRLLRAFARLRQVSRRNPVLLLCRWGQEVEQSEALIDSLHLTDHVVWLPPLNKMKLIDYYRASDVVLDQFTIGTFGTVTPEAMACEAPVILHFNRAVHEWCYSEMPPVVAAETEEQIFERWVELDADPARRLAIGAASRQWIVKHHGWELVADRQISAYREILQR